MLALFKKKLQKIWIFIPFVILLPLIVLFCAPFEQPISMLKPMTHGNISWCYKSRVYNSIRYFDDVSDARKQPTRGKSVFFHETSCTKDGIVRLNSKQACAIESAALHNPNRDVFVLFASPVGLPKNAALPQFIAILRKYPNIHLRNLDLWRHSIDTPIHEWLKSDQMFNSSFLFEHMSDILRAITLYRYGGFHMDLDVVVQKNVDNLGVDFVSDDWSDVVNGAVLHLNNFGIGKIVSDKYLREIQKTFDGKEFIANGPKLLTQICDEICGTKDRHLWTPERCSGLNLQPKERLYPIKWGDYMLYFDPNKLDEALQLTKNATLIHVWNDLSRNIWNKIGTNNAYQVIAKQNCPHVYSSSEYL